MTSGIPPQSRSEMAARRIAGHHGEGMYLTASLVLFVLCTHSLYMMVLLRLRVTLLTGLMIYHTFLYVGNVEYTSGELEYSCNM